ncbi:MAG TPA: hypothetical protein VM052_03075 [Candidatus Limnocylindrales bacterium]|nr:hypothetical protein [Candidatus Limnocylindrales bacterium]
MSTELDVDVEESVEKRVSESVRHALRLVGPAEGGIEHSSSDQLWPPQTSTRGR